MPPRLLFYRLAILVLLASLAACSQKKVELKGAASEPATAVRELARLLRQNDLEGFARHSVPPADYARLQTAWQEGRSRWPLTELPMEDQLQPLLAALGAPDSERTLQQGFNRNFANQHSDLKDAAHSLGLFGVQYVKREGVYTVEERAHYAQVIAALGAWAEAAPLGDPPRGKAAIPRLAAAARKTGLVTEQDFQSAGMQDSLRRLAPFFAEAKATLASYGLPLDQTFAEFRTGLEEQTGDLAKVRVHYPLGDRQIDTVVSVQRKAGKWYLVDSLRHAEAALATPMLPVDAPQTPSPLDAPSADGNDTKTKH